MICIGPSTDGFCCAQLESAVPLMFDAMQPFDGQARIVVAACDNLVTTAVEVSELPWNKFVTLMKVRLHQLVGNVTMALSWRGASNPNPSFYIIPEHRHAIHLCAGVRGRFS